MLPPQWVTLAAFTTAPQLPSSGRGCYGDAPEACFELFGEAPPCAAGVRDFQDGCGSEPRGFFLFLFLGWVLRPVGLP